MLDFDLKERVRTAIDIVDVVSASLTVVPKGRMLAAHCPWHDDRSPSLTINQERQSWKCWVCDIGGDIFSFVMKRDGVDFVTALKTLAEQAGIEFRQGPQAKPGSAQDKSTLLAAVKAVAEAYYQQLDSPQTDDAKIAAEYLASRGIDDSLRKQFHIGFAPDSWDFATSLLAKQNFRPEIAAAAGVALKRREKEGSYDLFRGRLMFPIHDLQHRTISMGGRVIPEIARRHGDRAGGKYINGPETLLFRKSQQLYGLDQARDSIRKSGHAFVMEGYTDVIAAHKAGLQSAVAVLGTALGSDHVKLLKRLTQQVYLVLDGDAAGQRRAEEVLELFVSANADLRVITLSEGMDPADFLEQQGKTAFEALLEKAPDALQHKLQVLTAGVDLTHDTHAVTTAIDKVISILAKAKSLDPIKEDQILLRLSKTFGITADRLNENLKQKRTEARQKKYNASKFSQSKKSHPGQKGPQFGTAGLPSSTGQGLPSPVPAAKSGFNAAAPIDPNQLLSEVDNGDDQAWHHSDFDPAQYGYVNEGLGPDAGIVLPGSGAHINHSAPQYQPLSGLDKELFSAIIESPGLAAMAVEAIDPDWLDTWTAKVIFGVYQELDLEGKELDVESLMLVIENEFIKNEIVTLQFTMIEKSKASALTPEQRYQEILKQYAKRQNAQELLQKIAHLESSDLKEEEAVELLESLFEAERNRQQLDQS